MLITHSSQDVETAKLSNDRGMNKEAVVLSNNEMLFSRKTEGDPAICENLHEPRGHSAKCTTPDAGRKALCGLTYMWSLKGRTQRNKS